MRRIFLSTAAILSLALTIVAAQDSAQATIGVAQSEDYGEHLVNAEGFSLYLYTNDERGSGTSSCVDNCTRNWPPLTAEGEPVAAEGVDAELLGTIEREDGTLQVSYNGWPLYTYARDTEAGHTRGAGLGGVFFLVTPGGEIAEQVEQAATEVSEETFAQLMEEGQAAYSSNCAVCHGGEGRGGIGPALAGNSRLSDTDFLVSRILNGFPEHGMPPFAHLSDEQIAAVATFVRNSWSNEFGPVIPEEVNENR